MKKRLRIGYVPYSPDLSAPGDRRRFCFYARRRGLEFEVFRQGELYDVVVLSSLADLTVWSRAPRGAPVVLLDLPDAYLAIDPREPKAMLRGTAKFVFRQHRHWEWSYHQSLSRACRRANAVVCCTPEQRALVLPHSDNVHAILDFHDDDTVRAKADHRIGKRLNLVWEGLGGNVFTFARLAEMLAELALDRRIALHMITDLTFKAFNGPFPRRSTQRLVERLLPRVPVYLYQWHPDTFASIATACDIALIPIPMHIPIYRAKAENKLLLFWRLGLPVLTSPTPAYLRTMTAAGLEMTCDTPEDWRRQIDRLADSETLRREGSQTGREYAEVEGGTEAQMARWDGVFESLHLPV